MNKIMEKMSGKPSSQTITDALLNLQRPSKKGIDLLNIAKKLSSKKFGKK